MDSSVEILCLGSMDCFPMKGNDSSSYLINGHILIDTSYATVNNLLNAGVDPLNVDKIIFTHLHYDHYAGLSQLLYYIYLHGWKKLDERITLIGPPEQLEDVAQLAVDYFRVEDPSLAGLSKERVGIPSIIKLPDEGSIDIDGISIKFVHSVHPVPGRCYRFTFQNGKSIGFSGDTSYIPALDELFKNVDCLFYEASYGTKEVTVNDINGHGSAHDSGRIAKSVGAHKLAIVHSKYDRNMLTECASKYFDGPIFCPKTGDYIKV